LIEKQSPAGSLNLPGAPAHQPAPYDQEQSVFFNGLLDSEEVFTTKQDIQSVDGLSQQSR